MKGAPEQWRTGLPLACSDKNPEKAILYSLHGRR